VKLAERLGWRRVPLVPDAETGLTEIEYAVGDHRIRVAREPTSHAGPKANGHASLPPPAAAPIAPVVDPPVIAATSAADHPGAVTAPIVGIAYLAPEPGAPPFVRVGDNVAEGDTLLIIEAMKVMNQIRAPRAGRITRVFAEDGEPVEYGAALLLIE
jgi:acetyl-CoA carboxylase biotin carboxyl carrier protein